MRNSIFYKYLQRFARNEQGVTLVEMAFVIPLLLVLVLGAVDYGRFGHHELMARKAVDLAVRTAAVRPPVCDGIPDTYQAVVTNTNPPQFGSLCLGGGKCAAVATQTCSLANPGNTLSVPFGWTTATDRANSASEIWATIAPLLPNDAQPSDVWVTYQQDTRLGFLGGPYTPIVTVSLARDTGGNGQPNAAIPFNFITPLGQIFEQVMGINSQVGSGVVFPVMRASMPAEDLGQGTGFN